MLSRCSTLRLLEAWGVEAVTGGWPSLAWPGLVIVEVGMGLRCPLSRPLGFLGLFLSEKLFPSSDIRTGIIEDRWCCWSREHSEGRSTLHVRLLEFRQFTSEESGSFKRMEEHPRLSKATFS